MEDSNKSQGVYTYHIIARFCPAFLRYYYHLPADLGDDERFLLNFNYRCKKRIQPLGINKLCKVPKFCWAKLLGVIDEAFLKSLSSLTLHRTGAALLANAGTEMVNIKRMGRWKSDKCVKGYIDESRHLKGKRMEGLDRLINPLPTKKDNHTNDDNQKMPAATLPADPSSAEPTEDAEDIMAYLAQPPFPPTTPPVKMFSHHENLPVSKRVKNIPCSPCTKQAHFADKPIIKNLAGRSKHAALEINSDASEDYD